jgi:hypothetical protein
MIIRIAEKPHANLSFWKGELEVNGNIRLYQITLDENKDEFRKKINFYTDGSKFTEVEKVEILTFFNEKLLNQNINENIIEE